MKSSFLLYAYWLPRVVFGFTEYGLDLKTVAIYDHVDKPFSQGFAAEINDPSVGTKLDDCVEFRPQLKDRAACYAQTLKQSIVIYESSGLYGSSYVQRVDDFDSGIPTHRLDLPGNVFAEGLTFLNDGLIALGTWREGKVYVLQEKESQLSLVKEMSVTSPGSIWGLTSDGTKRLWATSGNDQLFEFSLPLDPEASKLPEPRRKITLTCGKRRISKVNELEYDPVKKSIWGNVWLTDDIYEFDLENGKCKGVLRLGNYRKDLLMPDRSDPDTVLNGIALLGNDWTLFTGKRFPFVYLAKFKILSESR